MNEQACDQLKLTKTETQPRSNISHDNWACNNNRKETKVSKQEHFSSLELFVTSRFDFCIILQPSRKLVFTYENTTVFQKNVL